MESLFPFTREDVLEQMLQQAVSTIEFLHGCLTDPVFSYAHPEQTTQRLQEFRSILPERRWCVHSGHEAGCPGCAAGDLSRQIMGKWREANAA